MVKPPAISGFPVRRRGTGDGPSGRYVIARVPPPTATDAELLAATSREPAAFGVFYDRYERAVVGFFVSRLGDPELAADLAGEAFAAALATAALYRPAGLTAAPWLFTIANRVLAASLRDGQVQAQARLELGIREPVSSSLDELQRIAALAADDGWAAELLAQLPGEQRAAMRDRVLDERPSAEIAYSLQTSELVIRTRTGRGPMGLGGYLEPAR